MLKQFVLGLSLNCALLVVSGLPAERLAEPLRDRREFATAISTLQEGTPQSQVLARLGPPDEVRTPFDLDGHWTFRTQEIWRYGTSGRLTMATLGEVYIDTKGCAQYIIGSGLAPPPGLFEEKELRQLLVALWQVPSYNSGERYNPRNVIKAVNLLQPLGKDKALRVIDEFLRVSSFIDHQGRDGVFLVLRTLFDVPSDPGYMPRMRVGASFPSDPDDPKRFPRFPITIEGDIPFLLVMGYSGSGHPEPPESHVAYFREHGTIRANPLAPTNRPFAALGELEKSPRWDFAAAEARSDDFRGRLFIGAQILRLMDTVYPLQGDERYQLSGDEVRAKWARITFENSSVRWDAGRGKYVLLHKTTRPEARPE